MIPLTIEKMVAIFPASFASSSRLAPRRFPTTMLPALPRPMQKQMIRLLEILAMPFAATASLPICPRITEYMVNPPPHASSLNKTGAVFSRNPFHSSLLTRTLKNCTCFLLIITYPKLHTAWITVAITVASAAPRIPIRGLPQSPKMKMAFNIMFRITATILKNVLIPTAPQFFISVILICETPRNR